MISKEDINAKDKNGRTPLHNAAQTGNIELLGWLLERKASVDERDTENNTALLLAVKGILFPSNFLLIIQVIIMQLSICYWMLKRMLEL